jgi:hypothetical protein
MEENLTSVNAEQASVEGLQTETKVVTGEEAVVAEQQTTETEKIEPKKQTPEENAAYKALRLEERQRAEKVAAQAAVDAEYAALATRYQRTNLDGTPITTKAEWEASEQVQQRYDALINQGVSDEAARLKIEIEQLMAREADRIAKEQKTTAVQNDQNEFFQYFRELNGRDWTPADLIPDEVWAANADGTPLKYAYMDYTVRQMKAKEKSIETGKKTAEVNASNALSSTGSVTGGGGDSGEITQADIDAHANDTTWMMKNYTRVVEALRKKG